MYSQDQNNILTIYAKYIDPFWGGVSEKVHVSPSVSSIETNDIVLKFIDFPYSLRCIVDECGKTPSIIR